VLATTETESRNTTPKLLEVDVSGTLRVLPRGGNLPPEAWHARHRAVLFLLWAHAVGVPLFGITLGFGALHSAAEGGIVAALAAASSRGSRRLQTTLATLGLLSSSAILVHMSGGVIEMHFHFFVMMVVITMYQDWTPFLVAVAYVVIHHGVVGAVDPTAVFNHPDAWRSPWKWASIHGAFILAASVAGAIHWRMQERAQNELRRVQEHFRDAFESAPIGMALVGLDGRWLQVNKSVCEITGYPEGELLNISFQDFTHPDDIDEDLELASKLVDGEIGSYQLEKRYVHARGHEVPILLSVTLVKDSMGDPQYFIAQIQDMTERRKADEYYRRLYEGQSALVKELQEAHRLRSELFNIVSHEFKTPLAAIIGFIELLTKKPGEVTEESRQSYLQVIARQAERLNRLVENLLLSARQIEPVTGVVGRVEDALGAVQAQLADTYEDVTLDASIEPGLRPEIPQEALRLVLLNLASNAVRHAAPHTAVRVAARQEEEHVTIRVTNVGESIPPEIRTRIFDPFVQGAVGRTAEGVGLGLHIVHKLALAYGGSVEVDSKHGEVTFGIKLPTATKDANPPELELHNGGRVA